MGRKTISMEQLDDFEVDEAGRLYWRGQTVLLEQRVTLRGLELTLAAVATVSTALMALWPIAVHLSWV